MATKYDIFKERWLEKIEKDSHSNIIKGRKFAKKLLKEWLGHDYDDSNDIIYGFGDREGGIDIAYLQRMDNEEENGHDGNTWFFIQTEYGRVFTNPQTILSEGSYLIYALDGKKDSLSSLPETDTLQRLQAHKNLASDKDKFVLVLATIDPLNDEQKESLNDIKGIGSFRLGPNFDVININLRTLFNRHNEDEEDKKITVPFYADLEKSGDELLIGSVKLRDLYAFLKEYENKRGEFDLIYKKNVRMFLGGAKKINQGIADTIRNTPERFGLYNNGITIVVEDYKKHSTKGRYELTQPFIVNGCQTTKIIYRELKKKIDNPSFYRNAEHEKYIEKLNKGILVVKIVKATDDESGRELLKETTKYTNSQNTVSLKDFIALDDKFQFWAKQMAQDYNVFLEIQRGEYLFKKDSLINDNWANAFDLIKIYGSAWLKEPGTAFGKNQPFAPGGRIFKKITESKQFGVDDLYASYLLRNLAKEYHFGERTHGYQRAQTTFLFCYIFIQLLTEIMENATLTVNNIEITRVVNIVLGGNWPYVVKDLCNATLEALEEYMTLDKSLSIYKEKNSSGDANAYLKNEKLGKNDYSPNLYKLIENQKNIIKDNFTKYQDTIDSIAKAHIKTIRIDKTVTGTKPYGLTIKDTSYTVNSWKIVLQNVMNYVADEQPDFFENYAANKIKLLNRDKSMFRDPKELKNGYYLETNYNADSIVANCRQILNEMGISDEDWSYEYH